MNQQIARLALIGIALIAALIVATTYWQTWAAAGLADRQDNEIQRVAQFSVKRGLIRAADGTILATNRRKRVNGQTLYFRRYPTAGLFAQIVGYSTQSRSRTGLEASENDYLTGSNTNLKTIIDKTLNRLRGATIKGNDLWLTLRPTAQRLAMAQLAGKCGAAALLLVYMIFVLRGMRIALLAQDGFSKLLAAGLTFGFALQTFIIVGGILRLIPLTGITLPFVSYGGSSVVANFLLLAGLLLVSNRANREMLR